MIIGETEEILANHDLYNEEEYEDEYDDWWWDKKTPEEKAQREKEKQLRREQRHKERLEKIKRRNERRQARDADPNREKRRQNLFGDIGDTVSDVVRSVIEGRNRSKDNSINTPTGNTNTSQQPTASDINFAGFGGFGGNKPKNKDNTLYIVIALVGTFVVGGLLLSKSQNNSTN